MTQRLYTLRRNDAGFTLVELLVVVLILGVLSGIVVFAVSNFNNQGVTAACRADIKNVEIADEAYVAQHTGQPAGGIGSAADPNSLVGAKYLREAPSSTKYFITLAADGTVTGNLGTPAAPGAAC